MQINIKRDSLHSALDAVKGIVKAKTILPILANILISADDTTGLITLTSTDLDTYLRTSLKADVKKSGTITVPAMKLGAIVNLLAAADISIEVDEKKQRMNIEAGTSMFKLYGLDSTEFPTIPKHNPDVDVIVLDQRVFAGLIATTEFCSSDDQSRYVLNGVNMSVKKDSMTAAGTDGRRLAMSILELDNEFKDADTILPNPLLSQLKRLVGSDKKGTIELRYGTTNCSFVLKSEEGEITTEIFSKVIEGTFPNYRQVIPSNPATLKVSVNREDMARAIHRASLMTSDKSSSVKFTFEKHQLILTANAIDTGEAREVIDCKVEGKYMSIALNPDYMIDALNVVAGHDIVNLELIDELTPLILKAGAFLYVCMPMRMVAEEPAPTKDAAAPAPAAAKPEPALPKSAAKKIAPKAAV